MHISELVSILKKLRRKLLDNNDISTFNNLLEFMLNPYEIIDLKDNNEIEVFDETMISKDYLNSLKKEIYHIYCNNKSEYREFIINGQCDIWDNIGKVYMNLFNIMRTIENTQIDIIDDSYYMACKEVRKILELCSACFSEVSKYEQVMGIDRYLSDINKADTETLYNLVQKIKNIANRKLHVYKYYFQKKWNITAVSDVIKHMLLEHNYISPITKNIWGNQQNVILFIIDGFGYSQYLWNLNISTSNKSYTLNENIFSIMKGKSFYKDDIILGSSFVSDTGAGLAQIYTGKLPRDTGLVASKVYRKDGYRFYHYNDRLKSNVIDVKNISFCFNELINPEAKSFIEELKEKEVEVFVYYCSRYYGKNGFSKLCFGDNEVKEILPPERVFRILFDEIKEDENKQFRLVYYTSLDNTGHTTGAFSCFEYYEHIKINSLMTNFIIQLAHYKPSLFNGKTSVVITSDHGMAESSRGVIGKSDFYKLCPKYIENIDRIVECNRALLFYNVIPEKMILAVDEISNIFSEKGINAKVYSKKDDVYKELIFNPINEFSLLNSPDIIALIEGEGIIYSKSINENLYHFSGHGGCGLEEVFVPLICINLNEELKELIDNRYLKMI